LGKEPNRAWSDTEIVQDQEVCVHTGRSLDYTDLEVGEGDKLGIYKMIFLGVSWCSVHDIELWVFVSERDGWDHVGTQVNTEDEDGGEWKWNLEEDEENEWKNLWDVGGEGISDGFLQVIEDKSSFLNTVYNRAEVVIEQEHVGSILGNI